MTLVERLSSEELEKISYQVINDAVKVVQYDYLIAEPFSSD